jgi:hypothetical protein
MENNKLQNKDLSSEHLSLSSKADLPQDTHLSG